jgi:hypothetical protein
MLTNIAIKFRMYNSQDQSVEPSFSNRTVQDQSLLKLSATEFTSQILH